MLRDVMTSSVAAVAIVVAGCAAPQPSPTAGARILSRSPAGAEKGFSAQHVKSYRSRAMEYLRAAVHYRNDPAVRAEAVEALEIAGTRESFPWIRAALTDPHPGVRFAACVTIGQLNDKIALRAVRNAVTDENCSVQAAALFALHRMGDESRSGRLPNYVLSGDNVTCRRNAALVLGMLDERSGIKVLARAMKDPDFGVRHHALEAMARLGNSEARQELAFMTSSGVGSEEIFAITALSATRDPIYADTFRYKLTTAPHLETRLAAARALGTLGLSEGFSVAIEALRGKPVLRDDAQDPAPQQRLRISQMAMAALGAIGRTEALPVLMKLMDDKNGPHVRVSAARAILEIIEADRRRSNPFSSAVPRIPSRHLPGSEKGFSLQRFSTAPRRDE